MRLLCGRIGQNPDHIILTSSREDRENIKSFDNGVILHIVKPVALDICR